MFGLQFTLKMLLNVFAILVCAIVPFFIILFLFCVPYYIYLGCYIAKHDLPKDFRKTNSVWKEVKNAAKLYWDLIRFKKPTF